MMNNLHKRSRQVPFEDEYDESTKRTKLVLYVDELEQLNYTNNKEEYSSSFNYYSPSTYLEEYFATQPQFHVQPYNEEEQDWIDAPRSCTRDYEVYFTDNHEGHEVVDEQESISKFKYITELLSVVRESNYYTNKETDFNLPNTTVLNFFENLPCAAQQQALPEETDGQCC